MRELILFFSFTFVFGMMGWKEARNFFPVWYLYCFSLLWLAYQAGKIYNPLFLKEANARYQKIWQMIRLLAFGTTEILFLLPILKLMNFLPENASGYIENLWRYALFLISSPMIVFPFLFIWIFLVPIMLFFKILREFMKIFLKEPWTEMNGWYQKSKAIIYWLWIISSVVSLWILSTASYSR